MLFKEIASWHYRPLPALSRLLAPLEWGYGLGVNARLLAYYLEFLKAQKVSVPVISIGNLTTGGTGKTPVVLGLAEALIANGRRVVILSRGYGAEVPVESKRAMDPRYGDEAYFLQQQLEEAVVIVGKDRASNAKKSIFAYQPDVILLDDGYQYLKLARKFNILLVDGENRFGNYHMLPLGPLREPLREIRRADLIWVTKGGSAEFIQSLEGIVKKHTRKPIPIRSLPFQRVGFDGLTSSSTLSVETFREMYHRQPCVAFSGIAQPDSFEEELRLAEVPLIRHVRFGDHHIYTPRDIETILNSRMNATDIIITTEKDKVKIEGMLPEAIRPFVYTLKVRPLVSEFRDIVKEIFRSYDPFKNIPYDARDRQ